MILIPLNMEMFIRGIIICFIPICSYLQTIGTKCFKKYLNLIQMKNVFVIKNLIWHYKALLYDIAI